MDFNKICISNSPMYAVPVKQLSAKSKHLTFKLLLNIHTSIWFVYLQFFKEAIMRMILETNKTLLQLY